MVELSLVVERETETIPLAVVVVNESVLAEEELVTDVVETTATTESFCGCAKANCTFIAGPVPVNEENMVQVSVLLSKVRAIQPGVSEHSSRHSPNVA